MNNSDERDFLEENANRAEMQEPDHCIPADCIQCWCCCPRIHDGAGTVPNAGSAS
ncbi:hypothetical protein [Actinoplanes rectilineatus]|uniref:hypothetical protein n=1 Tax=Actinoplanes rectilineatus TaxID=113571 RepID=UPI000B2AB294|nr:hypothetical protein [Actinoplanes rectilineatus]